MKQLNRLIKSNMFLNSALEEMQSRLPIDWEETILNEMVNIGHFSIAERIRFDLELGRE